MNNDDNSGNSHDNSNNRNSNSNNIIGDERVWRL